MKRIIIFVLCAILLIVPSMTVYADSGGSSSVAITVVIPQTEPKTETPTPAPAPRPPINYLYPVSVQESYENGRREIIRTYELTASENPRNISRESFVRDGWLYELADIIKRETASNDVREHTEIISIDTATNETATILNQLALEMDFQSNDGYIGVLYLDIGSIKVETAGTRTTSHTVTATREYPHLSRNDTSFIPKTITDNGRTLTLSKIDWKVQNYTTIDYAQIPDSYTAIATYTGTASRTAVTGYITTAEYRGTLSKIITGKTVYTAYFIGVPILTPTINEPESTEPAAPETTQETQEVTEIPTQEIPTEPAAEPPHIEIEIPIATEPPIESETETEIEAEPEPEEEPNSVLPNILAVLFGAGLAGIGIGGGLMFLYLKNKLKKQKKEILSDEEEIN